jgi:DNA-binding FrmR family transcriptional regulator
MVNRLNRIQGQIGGISDMVANGQPCEEVAQQMSAVRRALEKAYMHMMTCTLMEVTDGYTSEGAVKQDVQRVLDLLQKYA